MIGYYMLQSVLACGYLELEEGSKIAVAINSILEEIDFSEQKIDASARKQAAKMLTHLQADGFFGGVVFEREAA